MKYEREKKVEKLIMRIIYLSVSSKRFSAMEKVFN